MKKLLFFLLSVVLAGTCGCGLNKDVGTDMVDKDTVKVADEVTTVVQETESAEPEVTQIPESIESAELANDEGTTKESATNKNESSTQSENKKSDETKSTSKSEDSKTENKTSSDSSTKKSSDNTEKNTTKSTKSSEKKTSDSSKTTETTNESENKSSSQQTKEEEAVSYSPDQVVSLAIAKCEAGGMITTEEKLKNNLAAGKITQEEYDEYYPLDGLEGSYYSVFVNVDLNKAATTSGKLLKSEEGIAKYIADMLLLESESVFNIHYVGKTKTSGETFYEFRCYR